MLLVAGFLKSWLPEMGQPFLVLWKRHVRHSIHLFETFSDLMYILYLSECYSAIGIFTVKSAVFEASTFSSVNLCVKKWSCIVYLHEPSWIKLARVAKTNESQQLLIVLAPASEHTSAWLWTSPNCHTWYLIVITEGGQSIRWSELRWLLYAIWIRRYRESKRSWVCGTELIIGVVIYLEYRLSLDVSDWDSAWVLSISKGAALA